ncbi:hypothetical protein LJC10_00595 [Selenomonadales bacterium OttesenSCG-928-I06]|nr:hypothetical protein [Selenomonadales bacterium OttesenSCG-928-I06]
MLWRQNREVKEIKKLNEEYRGIVDAEKIYSMESRKKLINLVANEVMLKLRGDKTE